MTRWNYRRHGAIPFTFSPVKESRGRSWFRRNALHDNFEKGLDFDFARMPAVSIAGAS
jgi:hypothetical protein